jgi:uncharacterized protein YacL
MTNNTIKNNAIKNNTIRDQLILFIVMFIIALVLDPMNIMIYSLDDYYLSKPLILSALYMASTMVWGHQIVHLLQKGIQHFNKRIFFSGLFLSLLFIFILRSQLFFTSKDWLKGMIPHHSVAITTTKRVLEKVSNDENENSYVYRLAKDIVYNQEREIIFMKNML